MQLAGAKATSSVNAKGHSRAQTKAGRYVALLFGVTHNRKDEKEVIEA